jgi:Ni,Fe-hydrogenase III large subunit
VSGFAWFDGFLTQLANAQPAVTIDDAALAPARLLHVGAESWAAIARIAAELACRHAGIWADQVGGTLVVHACFTRNGDYLVCVTDLPLDRPELASHSRIFPGVARLERWIQDMFGIRILDHPDPRRWIRHRAWADQSHPLRADFPLHGNPPVHTPADDDYPFLPVLGNSVYQIPVGPVHAGIIEPGHFRFHAIGEDVLQLEQRLGYAHKGIEKIAVGRDAEGLARLAGRISGDSTVAHAWAACQALERAARVEVPARALGLRAILAERERIANHLGDIGAICNDVGFSFALMQCSRLREDVLRLNRASFGHRLMMDCVVPGGVAIDLDPSQHAPLRKQNATLAAELDVLLPILDDQPSLEDRLAAAGVLSHEDARQLGVVGYAGKASGIDCDARRDHRYPPYDRLTVRSPCLADGDIAARVEVRALEIRESLGLIDRLLDDLPGGMRRAEWPARMAGQGLGIVEGWRGEILSHVRLDAAGRVARFFPRDPSWFSWPALERLIHGNIVPDFPVCNKSINGSYSGHDL